MVVSLAIASLTALALNSGEWLRRVPVFVVLFFFTFVMRATFSAFGVSGQGNHAQPGGRHVSVVASLR